MDDLSKKVALVTGSSRGIGAAIALLFAEKGAKVVIHGRDREALAAVQATIHETGGQAMSVTGDVTNFGDVEAMRGRVEAEFGRVDVLVANAGGSTGRPQPIEEITEESWRADIDTNLTATFLTIKSFPPGMKERGSGSIITMSSAAARRAHPHTLVAYAAAKTGVQILTQDNQLQQIPQEQQQGLSSRIHCAGSVPQRMSHAPPLEALELAAGELSAPPQLAQRDPVA